MLCIPKLTCSSEKVCIIIIPIFPKRKQRLGDVNNRMDNTELVSDSQGFKPRSAWARCAATHYAHRLSVQGWASGPLQKAFLVGFCIPSGMSWRSVVFQPLSWTRAASSAPLPSMPWAGPFPAKATESSRKSPALRTWSINRVTMMSFTLENDLANKGSLADCDRLTHSHSFFLRPHLWES